jgi:elongation factor 2 kinase
VKVQKDPFDEGAMRQCYRLKKLSQLPSDATNHHYHNIDWNTAPNYVAKSYKTPDGSVNVTPEGKQAAFDDIKLQYEAAHHADAFNLTNPPKKIHIIRAYAIEFVDREHSPVMTVERFIDGSDEYGVGYIKHNTNSGFVDLDEHRLTPQTFSAHSFYASKGERMVVDVQGVGDLYTDPQVHSRDTRFGDADLGIRGFALFFHSYKHTGLTSALGIPKFELSRSELAKQEEDEAEARRRTEEKFAAEEAAKAEENAKRRSSWGTRRGTMAVMQDQLKFERMTQKRMMSELKAPGTLAEEDEDEEEDSGEEGEADAPVVRRPRSQSTEDYEFFLVELAAKPPADMFEYLTLMNLKELDTRGVAHEHIVPDAATIASLAATHLEITMLYGQGRFNDENDPDSVRDVESAVFHLCYAAAYGNAEAIVLAGKMLLGLSVASVCEGMAFHAVDNVKALQVLRRALSQDADRYSRCIAASLMLKHCKFEIGAAEKVALCDDCINFFNGGEKEVCTLTAGDSVTAAYGGGESWYKGEIKEMNGDQVRVYYPDDDEEEWLPSKFVKKEEAAKFKVGDTVEAAFSGGDTWYAAEVRAVDGSNITVYYLEDQEEEVVSEKFVRGTAAGEEAKVEEKKKEDKLELNLWEILEKKGDANVELGDEEGARECWSLAGDEAIRAGKANKGMELKMKAEN